MTFGHSNKWVPVKEAEEMYGVAKTSVQAKLCAGYNVEHYYRRATSYGKKDAMINVGYMQHIQNIRSEAINIAHELVHIVKDVFGSIMAFSKVISKGDDAKMHSTQVYLNTNIWNVRRPRSTSDLFVSRRLCEFIISATEKLLSGKYGVVPDYVENDWLENAHALGRYLLGEHNKNKKKA